MKTYFEPIYIFSNSDGSIIDIVKNELNSNEINRLYHSVENATEEYSNFQLFGIGKPSAKQIERREKRAVKKAATKDEFKGLKLGQKILNITQKFNPAAAIPRSSALVGVRFNVFGIATRLYPALLTEQELKSRNFNLENAKKAREAWEKVKKIWIGLGGATPALAQAIKNGYDKPVFKTKKVKARQEAEKQGKFDGDYFSNYTGAEEAAAYISIGISLLGVVSAAIGKAGASKNPYQEGSPEYLKTQGQTGEMESPVLTAEQQEELNRVAEAARKDAEAGKGLDNTTADDITEDDKILGIPKTGFWIGVGVLGVAAIGLTIYALRKK